MSVDNPTYFYSDEVSATADTTTTSATDVQLGSMTITPPAGKYLVFFSTSVRCSSNGAIVTSSTYSGGVQVAHSERQTIPFIQGVIVGNTTTDQVLASNCRTTVDGTQAIETRWRTSAGTATAHERTMNILRVSQ